MEETLNQQTSHRDGNNLPVAEDRSGVTSHVITWAFSVMTACLLGLFWVHTHPAPAFVIVDVAEILAAKQKEFESIVNENDPHKVEQMMKDAGLWAQKLDAALTRLAEECNCAVINSAAFLKTPADGRIVPNATSKVKAMIDG